MPQVKLETSASAQSKADAAQAAAEAAAASGLAAHEADTTAVHGIDDTAQLARKDAAATITGAWDFTGGLTQNGAAISPDVGPALGWIVATEYGALGDGVANDTAALQTAIDVAVADNKPLYIPAGTYLTDPLTVALPIPIYGAGTANAEEGGGGTILKARSVGGTLLTLGTSDLVQHHGYDIRDLVLEGDNKAAKAITAYERYGTHWQMSNVWIRNCTTKGIEVPDGVHAFLLNWNNVQVWNCKIGADLAGYAQASTFTHCHFVNNDTHGCRVHGSDDYVWNDNQAISFLSCTFEQVSPTAATGSTGLRIENSASVYLAGCYFEVIKHSTNKQLSIDDAEIATSVHLVSCYFNGGVAVQYAIHLPATTTKGIRLTLEDCVFDNHTTGVIDNVGQPGAVIKADILGTNASKLVGHKRSTAKIAAGTSSVAVTHGLFAAPSIINVQPRGDMAPAVRWWVSTITATQFTINTDVAVTAETTFGWEADCREPLITVSTLSSATFTAADGTLLSAYTPDTGPAFSVLTGAPSITTNKLGSGSTSINQAMVNVGQTDITVEGVLAYQSGAAVQIMTRVADVDNSIRLGMATTGGVSFAKFIGGVATVIWEGAAPTYASGETHTFKLVTRGTTVEAWIDGVLEQTVTVTELASNTGAGVYFNGGTTARLDDFVVTQP